MKPTKSGVVKPEPYFEIVFGCTNRKFFNVKDELFFVNN